MPATPETQTHDGNPVRVVITPSQSSFFAGEHFSVTISFMNTRTPEAGPSNSKYLEPAFLQTRTHKRDAPSISSALLARLPTSPGTPRTLLNPSPRKATGFGDDALPRRKGLVGTMERGYQGGQPPQLIEQRQNKMLAKSLSISISSQELEEQLGQGIIAAPPASAPFNKQGFADDRPSPTSPHIPSPLSRTDTLPLASNHPHARKQSILDGQFSLDFLSPTTSTPPQPYTPTRSSLSLSTISESSFPVQPPTPSSFSNSPSMTPHISSPLSPSYSQPAFQLHASGSGSNTVQAYPSVNANATSAPWMTPRPHHNRRFLQQINLGVGQPLPPLQPINGARKNQVYQHGQRNAFSSTFPRQNPSELILYSYAQLVGTVHVLRENVGATGTGGSALLPTHEQAYKMNRIRRAL